MAKLTYFPQFTGYSNYISLSNLNNALGTTYLGSSPSSLHPLNIPTITFKTYAGIDVPTLIWDGNQRKNDVIVFIGECPARNSGHYKNTNATGQHVVIIGAPFGVNLKKVINKGKLQSVFSGLDIYSNIFNACLLKHDVYVTDIEKACPSQKNILGYKTWKSNLERQLVNEISNLLKIYQNIKIVCFGSEVSDFLSKSKYAGLINILGSVNKIESILHPSKTNWPNWKAHRAEEIFNKVLNNPRVAKQAASAYLNEIKHWNTAISHWAIDDLIAKGII